MSQVHLVLCIQVVDGSAYYWEYLLAKKTSGWLLSLVHLLIIVVVLINIFVIIFLGASIFMRRFRILTSLSFFLYDVCWNDLFVYLTKILYLNVYL